MYSILETYTGYGFNKYLVQLNKNHKLSDEQLMQAVDAPFGAPFGGRVEYNGDGTAWVRVYTQ